MSLNKTIFYNYLTGEKLREKGSSYSTNNWFDGFYEAALRLNEECPASVSNIQVVDANNNVVNDLKATVVNGNGAYYDSVLGVYYTNTIEGSNVPYHTVQSTESAPPVEYETKAAPF